MDSEIGSVGMEILERDVGLVVWLDGYMHGDICMVGIKKKKWVWGNKAVGIRKMTMAREGNEGYVVLKRNVVYMGHEVRVYVETGLRGLVRNGCSMW